MDIDNYYEQRGSGRPVVFVHGSYASTSTWKNIVAQLAASYHCIAIKLPGHGGAPDPDDLSAPDIETELAILEAVVNKLTDQPIHLVGHSYGGVVALAQALKGNLRIRQLTLFEPVAVWVLDRAGDRAMSARVDEFLAQYRRDVSAGEPYACGQVIDFWGGAGAFNALPEFIKNSMQALAANNIRHWDICVSINSSLADLTHCPVPARLVCGTQSNPVARAVVDHLAKALPDSKTYSIQGASHFLVTSHVNECLSVLNDAPPSSCKIIESV